MGQESALVGKPEGRRAVGTPGNRLEDIIQMKLKETGRA
jgi:hypothetical protein